MKFCLGAGKVGGGDGGWGGGLILVDMHTVPFFQSAITLAHIHSALSCQIYNQTLSAAYMIINISKR